MTVRQLIEILSLCREDSTVRVVYPAPTGMYGDMVSEAQEVRLAPGEDGKLEIDISASRSRA